MPFSDRAKVWEPKAVELRRLGEAKPSDRLDPWHLASKVGLTVVDARLIIKYLNLDERNHLFGDGRFRWSGGVYPRPLPDGTRVCILNPTHSRRRNKITLMEEIAHTYLEHVPSSLVMAADGLQFRDYDRSQEDDAYGVGAAALLPWQNFFHAVNSGQTAEELAEHFDVTEDLISYRIKITGAYRVYRARQRGA
jgi:hypothetical protein